MPSYICIVGNCSHARGWNSNGQPRNSDRLHRTKQQASQAMCTNWWSDTGEVSKYSRGTAAKETFVYHGAETPSKVLEHSVDKWNKCKEESHTKGCYDCNWALHVCKSGSNEVCSLRFCSQQQELPFNVKMFSKTLRLSPRIEFVFAPEVELVKKAEVMKVVDIKKLAVLWTLISQFGRLFFSSRHNLTFGEKPKVFPEVLRSQKYERLCRTLSRSVVGRRVKKNLVDHVGEMSLASAE